MAQFGYSRYQRRTAQAEVLGLLIERQATLANRDARTVYIGNLLPVTAVPSASLGA